MRLKVDLTANGQIVTNTDVENLFRNVYVQTCFSHTKHWHHIHLLLGSSSSDFAKSSFYINEKCWLTYISLHFHSKESIFCQCSFAKILRTWTIRLTMFFYAFSVVSIFIWWKADTPHFLLVCYTYVMYTEW